MKVWKHLGRSTPSPSNDREHVLALTQVESVCFSSAVFVKLYEVALSLQDWTQTSSSHMRLPSQTSQGLGLFGDH